MNVFFEKYGRALLHLWAAANAIGTLCALAQLWHGQLQFTSVAVLLFLAGIGAYCGTRWLAVSKLLFLFFAVLLILLVGLTLFSAFPLQVYVSYMMLACAAGMFRGLLSFALFVGSGRNSLPIYGK